MGVNGIYGLSGSGLDIESLVKMGMMSKQNQYDKMYQQQVYKTWQKEAYVGIYNDMKEFQSTMSTFKMQSNMNAMKATTTNSDVVSATANGAAAAMNHKVTVNEVASNAYVMTGDGMTIKRANESALGTSTKLADVMFESYSSNSDGTYTVNGDKVNASDVAVSLTIQDEKDATKTYTIEYTYQDLFEDDKTLSDFAVAFANSGASIQGNYDSVNDSFSLYNKTGGENNIIGLAANNAATATLLTNLNLATYNANDNTLSEDTWTFDYDESAGISNMQTQAGTNANVTIDGKTYTSDTNKLTVSGVTYTFNNVSAKDEEGKGIATTINVSQDTDTIVDYVKQFVTAYNTLLDSLNDKLSEERYSDYKPLTKAQEEEMKDDQIEKWNEKAKSGLLYNDSNVRSLVAAMREAIYTKVDAVDSAYNTLSSIGISSSNTKGHLELDEDKLMTALAADPDCVYQLFASDQDSSYIAGSTNKNQLTSYEKKSDYQNTGIANRLYNSMTTYMSVFSDYAGTSTDADDQSYLGKLITNLNTKMTNFKTLMDAYQTKLYNKYDAMEVALSQLGQTLSYITG